MSRHIARRFGRGIVPVAGTLTLLAGLSGIGLAHPAGASTASQKAAAKKTLLVLGDMPKGWTSTKDSGASSNFPGAKQLASCIGVPSSLISSNPPQVTSPDFHSADQTLEIDDSVAVFSSAKKATATLNALANAKTPSCMTTIMNGPYKAKISKSLGSGLTIGTLAVTRFKGPAHTAGVTLTLPIASATQSGNIYITILSFVKGALSQQITFDAVGTSFPSALALHTIAVAQKRL